MRYSPQRRESVLKKMMPPVSRSVAELAREEGISEPTLYGWRKQAREAGRLMPDADTSSTDGWSSADKFAAVVETAALSETELSEYCRKRGLYPEQVKAWRSACEQANDWERNKARELSTSVKGERERSRKLERELQRKDKALAEAAALLVLSKKAKAIWGEDEDV